MEYLKRLLLKLSTNVWHKRNSSYARQQKDTEIFAIHVPGEIQKLHKLDNPWLPESKCHKRKQGISK